MSQDTGTHGTAGGSTVKEGQVNVWVGWQAGWGLPGPCRMRLGLGPVALQNRGVEAQAGR